MECITADDLALAFSLAWDWTFVLPLCVIAAVFFLIGRYSYPFIEVLETCPDPSIHTQKVD